MTNETKSEITWINSDVTKTPFISVDTQLRLYFNAQARELIRSNSVMLGYDHANKRIIVGSSEIIRPANVKPHRLDKRGYTSARPFIKALGIPESALPLRYEYVGKDYAVSGSHAFELTDDPMAGGDGRL